MGIDGSTLARQRPHCTRVRFSRGRYAKEIDRRIQRNEKILLNLELKKDSHQRQLAGNTDLTANDLVDQSDLPADREKPNIDQSAIGDQSTNQDAPEQAAAPAAEPAPTVDASPPPSPAPQAPKDRGLPGVGTAAAVGLLFLLMASGWLDTARSLTQSAPAALASVAAAVQRVDFRAADSFVLRGLTATGVRFTHPAKRPAPGRLAALGRTVPLPRSRLHNPPTKVTSTAGASIRWPFLRAFLRTRGVMMRYRHVSYRYTEVIRRSGAVGQHLLWSKVAPELAQTHWQPPADVYETEEALVFHIELAGIPEEELVLSLYEDALVLEGERRWDSSLAHARFHRAEVQYGRFRLELPLPSNVDRDRIEGSYQNGFLTIQLPWKTRSDA